MVGEWEGGGGGKRGQEEEEEEGRQERTKTGQKVWTRCYKKTQTEIDTENRQTTVFSVAAATTAEKRAQCRDEHKPPFPTQPNPTPRPRRRQTQQRPPPPPPLLLSPAPILPSLPLSLSPPAELVIPEFSRFQQPNNVNQLKFA